MPELKLVAMLVTTVLCLDGGYARIDRTPRTGRTLCLMTVLVNDSTRKQPIRRKASLARNACFRPKRLVG